MSIRTRVLGYLRLTVLLLGAATASANEIENLPLASRVAQSHLIAIVRTNLVEDVPPEQRNPSGSPFDGISRFANAEVVKVLRGSAPASSIRFITEGSISESDPYCCEAGQVSLMFLVLRSDGYYEAVNGRYSAFDVRNGAVVGWPDHDGKSAVPFADVEAQIRDASRPVESPPKVRTISPGCWKGRKADARP